MKAHLSKTDQVFARRALVGLSQEIKNLELQMDGGAFSPARCTRYVAAAKKQFQELSRALGERELADN